MEWFNNLLHNSYFILCAMAIIIFLFTQLIKLPIKHFTNKIKDKKIRTIVNTAILLIPFGLGVLLEFLWSTYYLNQAFSVINGIGYGMAGVSLYGFIERFLKIKIDNPFDSEEGKAVTELVKNVTEDGKVDEEDWQSVQKLLSELDITKCNKETQEALKDLVEDITKDGKVDEKDLTAVQEFMNKVK